MVSNYISWMVYKSPKVLTTPREIHTHFCSWALFSSIKLIRNLFLEVFSKIGIQSELLGESDVLADCFRFCSEVLCKYC